MINKAGGMEVYLDKAKAADREIKMHVECYAGGIEIYIPSNVSIKIKSTSVFGDVSNKTENDNVDNKLKTN